MNLFLVVGALAVAVVGCGGSGTTLINGGPEGYEGAACYPNGTCNAGLTCQVNVCKSGGDGGSADASTDAPLAEAGSKDTGPAVFDDAGLPCPGASINHPGNNETRAANTSVPFIGRARDAACQPIVDGALVWVDSVDGPIGTGGAFNHTYTTVGAHTITLTATDSASNAYTAAISLTIN